MKKTHLYKFSTLSTLGLLFTMGCAQPAGDTAVGDDESPLIEQQAAPDQVGEQQDPGARHGQFGKHSKFGKRGRFGKGGPPGLLQTALHELTLTDAQRTTIQDLLAQLDDGLEGRRQGRKAFSEALASGVDGGSIDAAIIDQQLATMDQKMAPKHDQRNEALDALHSTLTPEQRSALVTGPAAKRRRGKSRMRGHHQRKSMLGRLLKKLDLSEEQRSQLKEARRDPPPDVNALKTKREERRSAMDAMLDAFAGDDFDASQFTLRDGRKNMMREHMQRQVDDLNAALPILTAEQKVALAAALREGPSHGSRGRQHRRGKRGR